MRGVALNVPAVADLEQDESDEWAGQAVRLQTRSPFAGRLTNNVPAAAASLSKARYESLSDRPSSWQDALICIFML